MVSKFPTQSSVMLPTSLSITSTCRFANDGTFLIFQYSFHTGCSVFGFTVDLQRDQTPINCFKYLDLHVRQFVVEFRDKVRIGSPDDIHLWDSLGSDEVYRHINVFRLDTLALRPLMRASLDFLAGMFHRIADARDDMRHLQGILQAGHGQITGTMKPGGRRCRHGFVLKTYTALYRQGQRYYKERRWCWLRWIRARRRSQKQI